MKVMALPLGTELSFFVSVVTFLCELDNSTTSSHVAVTKWPRPKQPFLGYKYTANVPFVYPQKICLGPHDFRLELMTNPVPVVSLSTQVYGVCSRTPIEQRCKVKRRAPCHSDHHRPTIQEPRAPSGAYQ